MPPTCRRPALGSKKSTGLYTAARAALGARTLKSGQSRWYVGYKKHTLRLWLPARQAVILLPLVSWITPANVAEGGLLLPSLRWCGRYLGWWPGIIVADMSYLGATAKTVARTRWQSAVVTKLRSDMLLVPPYSSPTTVECPQGQPLQWWEYDAQEQQQWFRAPSEAPLCLTCWQAAHCPRHFAYPSKAQETLLGQIPLASVLAQRLLRQVRPWIEPAQSFEKNQLGLSAMFFNSLRFCWQMSLWADSAVLLRIMASLDTPPPSNLLAALAPTQLELGLL